jgi:FAD/FMN-containing dehydrogenase
MTISSASPSRRRDARVLTITTLEGDAVRVDPIALTELRRGLRGIALDAGMPEYDPARRLWNAALDRRPALIVRCADVHDVVLAVRFAERHRALISVRGGGHNAAGFAMCDGGMVIDLTALRGVAVDPKRRTARVAGGATFAEFDAATHGHGLASTGPIISMVGVGGYTLGGGLGWLHRKLGLASDNLIAAEVVLADGKVVQASDSSHEELFWALRGGGGNFGVVTSFTFRLAPLSRVLAGLVYHPLEALPEIAAFVREFNASAPDEVSVWLMLRRAPATPALPSGLHGRLVAAIAICYSGPTEEGAAIVEPLRRLGRPLLDHVGPRAYADWQRALDPVWGNGFGNHWAGQYLPELTDASAQTMLGHISQVASPFTDVKLVTLGGAMARIGEDATAFSHRHAKYAMAIQTRWTPPHESAEHLTWSREFLEAMQRHSTGGTYVNFMAADDDPRVRAPYNPRTLRRLGGVKALYDPENRFRMNHNILPMPSEHAGSPTRDTWPPRVPATRSFSA